MFNHLLKKGVGGSPLKKEYIRKLIGNNGVKQRSRSMDGTNDTVSLNDMLPDVEKDGWKVQVNTTNYTMYKARLFRKSYLTLWLK